MTQIHTFKPYVVCSDRAEQVVAPAYDSMAPAERAAYAKANPPNFIKTMRTPEDYVESENPSLEMVLDHNLNAVQKMLEDSTFELQPQEALYIYRLHTGDHFQTAVIAEVPVTEYQQGRIHKHEHTRSEHENRLTQYLQHVGVSSSPICLAYQDDARIDETVEIITQDKPLLDFFMEDGVRQTIWKVVETEQIDILRTQFLGVEVAYLTDGHHRMAASVRHAANRSSSGPWDNFLAALFPATQLRILSFNRCVRDLNGLSVEQLIDGLALNFTVDRISDDRKTMLPSKPGEFTLLVENQLFRLQVRPARVPNDSVGSLDVSLLQNLFLEPVLGIEDDRSDPRLDFVTGDRGLNGLRQRAEEGWQAGIACYPTSMTDLMSIADQGLVMPPKSTCFDPKARSGIFLRFS
ncbi:MAG: hypothetical protein CNF00_03905 [Candidatus Thioglobus sp. MED-G25]|nr:MAG: hypothetical protein CNF00_03905 [Candidatus Thioglobus sp. MED-G25]